MIAFRRDSGHNQSKLTVSNATKNENEMTEYCRNVFRDSVFICSNCPDQLGIIFNEIPDLINDFFPELRRIKVSGAQADWQHLRIYFRELMEPSAFDMFPRLVGLEIRNAYFNTCEYFKDISYFQDHLSVKNLVVAAPYSMKNKMETPWTNFEDRCLEISPDQRSEIASFANQLDGEGKNVMARILTA